MSAPTLYSTSKPRHPEVTGSPAQVSIITGLSAHVVTQIKAGNVATLGTTNCNTEMTYIVFPQVHSDLDGNPIEIIGNVSDV